MSRDNASERDRRLSESRAVSLGIYTVDSGYAFSGEAGHAPQVTDSHFYEDVAT